MTGSVLVTTAIEETWPSRGPVVFLGAWCLPFDRRDRIAEIRHRLVPYHWDDPAQLDEDRERIRDAYEVMLGLLVDRLNDAHDLDHGLRSWRILVGPWLQTFTTVVFDRWASVRQVLDAGGIDHTLVLSGGRRDLPAQRLADFRRFDLQDDRWNHDLFAGIIRHLGGIECREVPCGSTPLNQGDRTSARGASGRPTVSGVRSALVRTMSRFLARWERPDAMFLHNTYLDGRDELLVQRRLGQLPIRWHSLIRSVRGMEPVPPSTRDWTLEVPEAHRDDQFLKLLATLVPRYLPAAYLEDHRRLRELADLHRWPERPRLVWTSLIHSNSDLFRTWLARRVDGGTKLVVGQHGGGYGTARFFAPEDHERTVSDRFLTWGWDDPNDGRVRAVGQFKAERPLGVDHSAGRSLLMVVEGIPRFNHRTDSIGLAHHWTGYFESLCEFTGRLPDGIRDSLTVRLPPADQGRGEAEQWRALFPEVDLDRGDTPMNDLIGDCRLYLATYNSTTYLQTFTMDVPTVCFWDRSRWALRPSAEGAFGDLVEAGVLYHDPRSAARHVAQIWDDVGRWWRSDRVTDAVGRFTEQYSRLDSGLLVEVEGALREVLADTEVRA